MLLEITVGNYRSFSEPQTLSLVANSRIPSLPNQIIGRVKDGRTTLPILLSSLVLGANASGKSNFFRALLWLQFLITEEKGSRRPSMGYEPFVLDGQWASLPSVISVTICLSGTIFRYVVEVDNDRVVAEFLEKGHTAKPTIVFSRRWNKEHQNYCWDGSVFADLVADSLQQKVGERGLYLSVAAAFNDTLLTPIYTWFADKLTVINGGPNSGYAH
jgi:hypothetical protein